MQKIDKILRYISKKIGWIGVIGLFYIGYGAIKYLYPILAFGIDDFMENFTTRIDHVTIWLAGLTFLYSSRVWHKELKDNERIRIVLICKENQTLKKTLAYRPMRCECSRGEIIGILGMFYNNGNQRFSNALLVQPDYFQQLYDVQDAKSDTLQIFVPESEFEHFVESNC